MTELPAEGIAHEGRRTAEYKRMHQRQAQARRIGLCGAQIGHFGVCDLPAGHAPPVPGMWDHSERLHPSGPLGSALIRTDGTTVIRTDGTTVWIDVGGFTVGRFGKLGIDVHTADATGCIQCTHEPTTKKDWHIFVAAMFLHHNARITDEFMPERFR